MSPPDLPPVLSLADVRLTLSNAGGKALNLGLMLRAALPVPPGLVITTAAYRAFVADNGLERVISQVDRNGGEVEAASAQIRAAFAAGAFPAALAVELDAALEVLGLSDAALAVRSSATAEDLPEASFAGQQDSFLNVRGRAALQDAVRRCWGSLWTARAMAYRARQDLDPAQLALAVVVQQMAPAQAAGVLFTVHPLSGRADRVLINATWGLGEALVSGRVDPDSLLIDKGSGRLLREQRGDKRLMSAPLAQGTAELEVPAAQREARALDEAGIAALTALSCRVEALFGGPQDIEWALVDGAPVLLQSRPVTTAVPGDDAWPPLAMGQSWPFDFWTQQDMGERWPDPITPLTWSICTPMNQEIMDGMVPGLDAPYAGRIQWTCRAFGHVYMNEGAMLHAFTYGFGMPLSMVSSGLTHPGATPSDAQGWRLGRVLRHMPYFWAAATRWEGRVARFEADFPKIDTWVAEFLASDRAAASDAELLTEAQQTWYQRILHYVAFHTHATSLSMSSYGQLEDWCRRVRGDPSLAQVLVGGIQGVIAAEMVPALAGLAADLRAAGLADLVKDQPPATALAALRQEPGAAAFCEGLDRYLARHGHRCMVEAELRHPRWAEAPELVIEQIALTLRAPSPPALDASGGDPAADRREALTARIEAELGAFQRAVFRRLLQRAHHFTRMRDNGQSYVVKLLLPLRVLLASLGQRWAARGWLRCADDVFFLVQEELVLGASGQVPADLQARADARRRAHDYWCDQQAPEALDAQGEPVPAASSPEDGVLVGLAASRGTVTGTARVVLQPQDAARLQPGDILVTRATDPGWTPAFSVIGGAVIEIGGLLSHGAIVAREYGLPAVIGVPQATRRIADGQRITVDGGAGRVTLL